jgi:hypothetical protein
MLALLLVATPATPASPPPPQVRLLVEVGHARLDASTRHGFTPLDEAHAAAATAVVEFLETLVRGSATGTAEPAGVYVLGWPKCACPGPANTDLGCALQCVFIVCGGSQWYAQSQCTMPQVHDCDLHNCIKFATPEDVHSAYALTGVLASLTLCTVVWHAAAGGPR